MGPWWLLDTAGHSSTKSDSPWHAGRWRSELETNAGQPTIDMSSQITQCG